MSEITKAGWYYDNQLEDYFTSVTLHANQWWDAKNNEWIDWDKLPGGNGSVTYNEDLQLYQHSEITVSNRINGFGYNGSLTDDYHYGKGFSKYSSNGKTGCGYGIDPICTSILSEDFDVITTNEWSAFGNDPIAQMWQNLKPYAPYMKEGSYLVGTFRDTINAPGGSLKTGNEKLDDKLLNGANKVLDFLEKAADGASQYLNRSIITQGTRFSYYGGTGTTFGNLGMRFTLFPKILEDGTIESVIDQAEKLYPYFIGHIKPLDINEVNPDSDWGERINESIDMINSAGIYWQLPPGGFEPDLKDVDYIQKGTFLLNIGTQYMLTNLVCDNATFKFSKQMVKHPKRRIDIDYTRLTNNTESIEDSDLINFSPLYCEVNLSLKPVSKYSDESLRKFVRGNEKRISAVKKSMEDNISNAQIQMKQKYNINNV